MADPLDEYAPSSLAHSFADQYLNEPRESATPNPGSMTVHPPQLGEELGNLSNRLFGDERLTERPAEIAPALGVLGEGLGALPKGAMSVERALTHSPERDLYERASFSRLMDQIDRGEGVTSQASRDAEIVRQLAEAPRGSITPTLAQVNPVNRHGRAAMNAPQGQRFGAHQARRANEAFNEDRPWLTRPGYEPPYLPGQYTERDWVEDFISGDSPASRWARRGATAGFWGGLGTLGYLGEQAVQHEFERRREDEGKAFDPKNHALPNKPFYPPALGEYDEGQAFAPHGEAPRSQPMPLSESYFNEASKHARHRNDIPETAGTLGLLAAAPYMAGRRVPTFWKWMRRAFSVPVGGFAATAPLAYMENDKRAQAALKAGEFWKHAGEKTGLPEGPDINAERQGKAPGGPVTDDDGPLSEYHGPLAPMTSGTDIGNTVAQMYREGDDPTHELPRTGSIESRTISPLSHPDEWLKQHYGERVGSTLAMPYETGANLAAGAKFGDEDRLRQGLTGALQTGIFAGMGTAGPPNHPGAARPASSAANWQRYQELQRTNPGAAADLRAQATALVQSEGRELFSLSPAEQRAYMHRVMGSRPAEPIGGDYRQVPYEEPVSGGDIHARRLGDVARETLARVATVNPAVGMPMIRELARRSVTLQSDVERYLRNEEIDAPAFDRIRRVIESDASLMPDEQAAERAARWDQRVRGQRGEAPPTSEPEILPPKPDEKTLGHFVPMQRVPTETPGTGSSKDFPSLMERLQTIGRARRYDTLPMDVELREREGAEPNTSYMYTRPSEMHDADVGVTGVWLDPRTFQIQGSQLAQARHGQGLGMALYQRLIDEAFQRGAQRVFSDWQLSPYSRQIYPALERRGYRVTRDPSINPESTRYFWAGSRSREFPGIYKVEPPLPLDDPRTFGPGGAVTYGHQPLAANPDDEVFNPFWSKRGIPGYTSDKARKEAQDYLEQERRRQSESDVRNMTDSLYRNLQGTLPEGPGRFANPSIRPQTLYGDPLFPPPGAGEEI